MVKRPGFNLFMVEDGVLLTPKAGVLDGMTRRTLFELCDALGIEARLTGIAKSRLAGASEVFLSSSAGGVIPITTVDSTPVANGAPGLLTTRLDTLYWSKREAGWHATPVDYRDVGPSIILE